MPTSAAPMAAGSGMAAVGGTKPTLAVVANQEMVSTANSMPGATATGQTTCTGHGTVPAAATPASEAWAAGTTASTASMGFKSVIASVVVALVGGGSAAFTEGSGGKGTDKFVKREELRYV
jgi:hypothetical protein